MTTIRSAALTLLLLLANSCPFTWASPAFKDWGKTNLYLPNDATDDEKRIANIAAAGNPTEALAETVKAIKGKKDVARLLLMKIELSERLLPQCPHEQQTKTIQPRRAVALAHTQQSIHAQLHLP